MLIIMSSLVTTISLADTGEFVSRTSPSRSTTSSSRSDDGGFSIILIYLILKHPWLLIPLAILWFASKRSQGKGGGRKEVVYTNDNKKITPDQKAVEKIKKIDPGFDEQKFIAKVNNMFIQLQNAWTKKEWRSIRPFETDELFSMHERQLQSYINNKTTNVIDKITIFDTEIVGFRQDAVNDIVDVLIKARFNDYVVDDETGKVIVGDPHQEFFMTYNWKLIRKKGVKTKTQESGTLRTDLCPQCGAPVSINATGECEYCRSVVTKGDYDWVLSEIELIEQVTGR